MSYTDEQLGNGGCVPYQVAASSMLGANPSRAWNRGLRCSEDEYTSGCLLSEAVVMQRRPLRDGGGIDQGHGNLELVSGRDAGDRGGQRIQASAQ